MKNKSTNDFWWIISRKRQGEATTLIKAREAAMRRKGAIGLLRRLKILHRLDDPTVIMTVGWIDNEIARLTKRRGRK